MKSIHDLLGMSLVTVLEGTHLGALRGVEVDTAELRIRFLRFDGAKSRANGVIAWDAVRAVGADAITVDSLASVLEMVPAEESARVTATLGSRPVVTEQGRRLGRVTDYEVDETTGHIERYHVATGGLFGRLAHREITFTPEAVRVFGPDALIVADAAAPAVSPPAEATTGAERDERE